VVVSGKVFEINALSFRENLLPFSVTAKQLKFVIGRMTETVPRLHAYIRMHLNGFNRRIR
jgi:hypothetical protein